MPDKDTCVYCFHAHVLAVAENVQAQKTETKCGYTTWMTHQVNNIRTMNFPTAKDKNNVSSVRTWMYKKTPP